MIFSSRCGLTRLARTWSRVSGPPPARGPPAPGPGKSGKKALLRSKAGSGCFRPRNSLPRSPPGPRPSAGLVRDPRRLHFLQAPDVILSFHPFAVRVRAGVEAAVRGLHLPRAPSPGSRRRCAGIGGFRGSDNGPDRGVPGGRYRKASFRSGAPTRAQSTV